MSINFEALFLGPQSENRDFFAQVLNFMFNEHVYWRRNFHPEDLPSISQGDQRTESFVATQHRTQEIFEQLSARLKLSSLPHHAPRHLAHMASDVMMPAVVAYVTTLLYNPNNIAWEGSPATTPLEQEVADDFIKLVGYHPDQAFGHLTSGGHVANYEALWIARNLKSIPYAIQHIAPELLQGMSETQRLNLPVSKILDMIQQNPALLPEIRNLSARGKGVKGFNLGKVLVPQSKHFSWSKAVDLLGLGQECLLTVRVTDNYRLDMTDLSHKIETLIDQDEPILAVIGIVGTTEEGAVDPIDQLVALRTSYEHQKGISFYIHVDAAYGGYFQSLFRDEANQVMPMATVQQIYTTSDDWVWPPSEIYQAFQALQDVDSITINPHKLGYIPFGVGGLLFRDSRVSSLISIMATYVAGEKNEEGAPFLGGHTMEGTKSGATAAAVWASHRALPLNKEGYGKLLGAGLQGARRFYDSICQRGQFQVGEKWFQVMPLTKPDTNIVVYALNEKGNRSLAKMNHLNRRLKEHFSYTAGTVHQVEFILSSTTLTPHEYDDVPLAFLAQCGIPESEWAEVGELFILRSTIMNPYIALEYAQEDYLEKFFKAVENFLKM